MNAGFLYIVYGDSFFFEECLRSIKSLRGFSKLPIHIKTDNLEFFKNKNIKNLSVQPLNTDYNFKYRTHQKLSSLKDIPFDITFFTDTDTFFLNNPEILISSDFDLQICREMCWRTYRQKNVIKLKKSFNSGFFVAKKNIRYQHLISKALDILHNPDFYPELPDDHFLGDQWYINEASLYVFDLNIKILSPSWNVRPILFNLLNSVIKKPNLLHARGGELSRGLKLIK